MARLFHILNRIDHFLHSLQKRVKKKLKCILQLLHVKHTNKFKYLGTFYSQLLIILRKLLFHRQSVHAYFVIMEELGTLNQSYNIMSIFENIFLYLSFIDTFFSLFITKKYFID